MTSGLTQNAFSAVIHPFMFSIYTETDRQCVDEHGQSIITSDQLQLRRVIRRYHGYCLTVLTYLHGMFRWRFCTCLKTGAVLS